MYFVSTTSFATTKKVEIHRGATGKVVEFYPWQINPLQLASTADPGIVNVLTQQLLAVPNTTLTSANWTYEQQNQIYDVFQQLINGVLYCTFLRTSATLPTATVTTTRTFQFAPPSIRTQTESVFVVAANYDILTVAVDLETAAISAAAAPLYSTAISSVSAAYIYSTLSAEYTFARTIIYNGYRQAIIASLPNGHPFTDCGSTPWNDVSNLNAEPGNYSFALDPGQESAFFLPYFSIYEAPSTSTAVPWGSGFSFFNQPSAVQERFANMKGVDLSEQTRVFGRLGYLEFSSLGSSWLNCNGYGLLGTEVASTWSEYSPAGLTPREDLLEVEGLAPEDQLTQLQDPETPPIASFPISGSEQDVTFDPVYFRETTSWPLLAGSSLLNALSRHYLFLK